MSARKPAERQPAPTITSFSLREAGGGKTSPGNLVTASPIGEGLVGLKIARETGGGAAMSPGLAIALDAAGAIALGRYLISAGQRLTPVDTSPGLWAEARMAAYNTVAGREVISTISARELATGDIMLDILVQESDWRKTGIPGAVRESAGAVVVRGDLAAFARALLVMAMDR